MLPNDRLVRTFMIIVVVFVILGLVFSAVRFPV
ncbi:hypothetical protein BH24CHL6_BH24CHL6_02290 [soil metagenome]